MWIISLQPICENKSWWKIPRIQYTRMVNTDLWLWTISDSNDGTMEVLLYLREKQANLIDSIQMSKSLLLIQEASDSSSLSIKA